MNRCNPTRNGGTKCGQNGRKSKNGIICKGNKDAELAPPLAESEIPWEESSNHQEFSWRALIIVAISLIITLPSVYLGLFYDGVKYSSTNNFMTVVGSLICMFIMMCFETRVFRRSSSKNILLALFAAAHLCTHQFCISLLLNFQKVIDGQYEKGDYAMAALCLGQDAMSLSLFVISLCAGEVNDNDDDDCSSSDDSGGGSSGGSS
ncbi:uncharacterized protein LOC128251881 [Drosophila gunungcola]|uniref:Uncharacterized protein n=1 Tax=Drosophila gunungcola TaxID=103775 RepID=A0A9P9YVH2_9MUSC|nr:uncharacterized protein LOC128251881 [Drosophila gunungcola]KAI8043915.1 hypothetical protein M5D96_000061 [Drosophila gunungcola]